MRFLSTRIHGVMDYALGVLLVVAPYLLGFATGGAEQWIPILLGIGIIGYSLCTRYELGLFRTLSMPVHLALDFLGGAFLAASPWLFGFAEQVYLPHLIIGLVEIGTSMVTRTVPDQDVIEAGIRDDVRAPRR